MKDYTKQHIVATIIGMFILAFILVGIGGIVSWCENHIELARTIGRTIGITAVVTLVVLPMSWVLGTGFITFVWESYWCIKLRSHFRRKRRIKNERDN